MRRKSLFSAPASAVDREVPNSVLDKIDVINANMDHIEALGTPETVEDMAALADLDFSSVLQAASEINNLTVVVTETLPAGQPAEAVLVGNQLQLKLPAGHDGLNGVTPEYEFTYNPATGDLEYELVRYIDLTTGNTTDLINEIKEW